MPGSNTTKRQKTDRESDLRLIDSRIDLEAQILGKLRDKARAAIRGSRRLAPSRPHPTLYVRYRGNAFPLRTNAGRKLPKWRDLSPWMKLQMATLAMAEGRYLQFTVRIHDDLSDSLVAEGKDLKIYLRDRISRLLRNEFRDARPSFFFVMEDRNAEGCEVRPHAHGSITIPAVDVSRAQKHRRRLTHLVAAGRKAEAELLVGRMLLREVLKIASGHNKHTPRTAASGRNQSRNIWSRAPVKPLFNHEWVTYAFKNEHRYSATLHENRVTLSRWAKRDAELLWNIVRDGDPALMCCLP